MSISNLSKTLMFRIILLISLILMALPFLNQAKNYVKEKVQHTKTLGEIGKKVFKYRDRDEK